VTIQVEAIAEEIAREFTRRREHPYRNANPVPYFLDFLCMVLMQGGWYEQHDLTP
jgi:hypothetical protein